MKILYRISSKPSIYGIPPLFDKNKDSLAKYCLYKFVEVFMPIKPEITFICDSCSDDLFKAILEVPFRHKLESGEGNYETYRIQLEMAKELGEEKVLLQEDDYLYQPGTAQELEKAIDKLEFVSPYDHPEHYADPLVNEKYQIRLINGRHWRTAPSNTLTFASTGERFKECFDTLSSFGIADHEMWVKMREEGHSLWTPIPSFATHMHKQFMAPSVDWKLGVI